MTTNKKLLMNRPIKQAAKPILLFVACNLLFAIVVLSQTFTTTVSPNKIGKNQYAVVTYEIGGGARIENFESPQFKDWTIASGPNNSSFSSITNGIVSRRTSISYYLKPNKTGKLTVDGARVQVDGKQMNSNSAIVEVMNKTINQQAQQSNNNTQDPLSSLLDDPFFGQSQPQPVENEFDDAQFIMAGENLTKKINEVLLLKVTASKNSCYEGEPIMATYKLYARLDVEVGFSKRPSFSGFSSFDMEEPTQSYTYEMLNGKKFKVYTIRKVQLYPLQSGTLTLDPVELECKMRFIKYEAAAAGNFDPYDNSNYLSTQYTLKSPAMKIGVMPLPLTARPAGFNGAVGDFSINALTNTTETGKDDATTLQVSIRGSGNFSMVQPPVIPWPKGIESYDPTAKENLIKSVMPISGDKTFEYVFLSHQPGKVIVPVIQFSYFDIAAKAYKTIETKPISLIVSAQSKRQRQEINDEAANLPLIFVAIAKYVLPVLAICLVLYLLFAFIIRKKRKQLHSEQQAMDDAWERMMNDTKQQANTELATHNFIGKTAFINEDKKYMPVIADAPMTGEVSSTIEEEVVTEKISLPQAEAALWMPDHKVFYQSLKNDIHQALAVAAGTGSANNTALLLTLQQRGCDINVLQQMNSILDECDAAIYSPVHYDADRQKTMEEVRCLLKQINVKG